MTRMVPIVVAGAALLALLAGPEARAAQGAPAEHGCSAAHAKPAADNVHLVREAILCLHNRIRARHGLPALHENARLRRAASLHSRDMVEGGFFEHTTPEGVTLIDRIVRARYVERDRSWALGENIGWGMGPLSTARRAVDTWMDSPAHRENILRRSYRELGVGVVLGVPIDDQTGATYTVDFGARR